LTSGDTALVVEFGDRIDAAISGCVLAFAQRVSAAALPGVIEVVPTFRSLMVHYDPLQTSHAALTTALVPMLQGLAPGAGGGRHWVIPTCYDASVALDLAEVAARTGVSESELVTLHATTTFHVYMLGFLPGFPYLGGLPKALQLPRRETPRLKVPPGSVAIAMDMTCIYTLESPGGWHVLGRTPVVLFDVRRDPPAPLAAGDKVLFEPISLEEYRRLSAVAHTDGLSPRRVALPGAAPR
jgi:KipI family sensor histidine kinase inhibitor